MSEPTNNRINQPAAPDRIHTLIMKGGGVKGLAFAGAVKVLHENGYQFNTYVGTSAGAVAAVLFAAGYSAEELKNELYKQPFQNFLDASFTKSILNLLIKGGMYPGRVLKKWIDDLLRQKLKLHNRPNHVILNLKDLEEITGNRIIVFASHLLLGAIVFDSKGQRKNTEVAHAVRLSASIPGIFIPGEENGYPVYDGALLNNFPVNSYQQVRGRLRREPGTNIVIEDFIALYVHDHDGVHSSGSGWWLSQALNIMLMRDETAILKEYNERSILIGTAPIRPSDFNLSNAEKDYLIEVGRHAALDFLSSPDLKKELLESKEKIDDLLIKVNQERKKRTYRKWVTVSLLFLVILYMTISLWWPNTYIYSVESILKHQATYIESDGTIQRIGTQKTIQELNDFGHEYGNEWAKGRFIFDSVFQFVLTVRDKSSARLIVWDGKYKTEGKQSFKLEASSNATNVEITYAIFVENHGKWTNWLSWLGSNNTNWDSIDPKKSECAMDTIVNKKTNKKEITIKANTCIPENAHIRIVELGIYPKLLDDSDSDSDVIPWLLFAHKGIDPDNGRATYLFLTDKEDTKVSYIQEYIYIQKDSQNLYSLNPPKNNKGICSVEGWERTEKITQFLQEIKDKYGMLNPGGSQNIIETIYNKANSDLKKSKELPKKTFVMQFDAAETKDSKVNEEKVVVFAKVTKNDN
jgi:hypothetical protein